MPAIQLFYRTEDQSSPNPTGPSYYSSSWIIGANNTGLGPVGSGNYYSQTDYTTTLLYYGWKSTSSGASITYTVNYPVTLDIISQTINLYCRIGLPMNSGFSFTYVTATVS